MAVYFAVLKPGDTVLGMNLAHGGHLTHGHPLNFSGQLYKVVPYGVKQGRRADRLRRARSARRRAQAEDDHGRRERLSARHRLRAHPRGRASASAPSMVTDMAHIAGLVAAGVHPSPVPHSDFVTTTTHKTLRGPRAGMVLCTRTVREGPRQGRVPRPAGRTARAHHRGEGRLLQGSVRAGVCRVSAADRGEREPAGRRAVGRRVPPRQRRHRQPPDARRRVLEGHHRQGSPRRRSARPASRSTRTRSRSIAIRRWWRAASASARRPSPREACARPRWTSSRISSSRALKTPDDDRALGTVRTEVEALCQKFPLYPDMQA